MHPGVRLDEGHFDWSHKIETDWAGINQRTKPSLNKQQLRAFLLQGSRASSAVFPRVVILVVLACLFYTKETCESHRTFCRVEIQLNSWNGGPEFCCAAWQHLWIKRLLLTWTLWSVWMGASFFLYASRPACLLRPWRSQYKLTLKRPQTTVKVGWASPLQATPLRTPIASGAEMTVTARVLLVLREDSEKGIFKSISRKRY